MLSKFSVTALIASGALLMGAASVAAESSDPIKIAINSWTGQHISAHISGSVLQKAGYNVEYVTAGAVPQFAAISQGNIHLQPEAWGNNVGAIYENAVASGDIIKLGSLGLKPVEGWMYPPYMKEQCPGLPSRGRTHEVCPSVCYGRKLFQRRDLLPIQLTGVRVQKIW